MLNVVRTNALFCDKMETSCQKNVAKRSLYKEKDVSLQPCKLNNMNTNRTSKAFIVRTAITLLVMLLTSATVWAETRSIDYIKADGTTGTATANVLTGGSDNTLDPGWYVIDKDIAGPLKFNGAVNLIILDNKNVTITGTDGITVNGSLTIYGQSKGTGSLKITANGKDDISGFGVYAKKGEISINGGILTISATNYGIATYKDKSSSICDITITGGRITVTATNGIDADGNITLGCRKGTDYIFASSYSNNVIIAGQTLIDGMNAYNSGTINDPSVLSSKILAPDLFGISNGNTGTSSNPYAISTGDGLQLLATYVNNGYVFSGKFFTLNDDIAFNSSTDNNFTPIGGKFSSNYYAFSGSFNGNNHMISGINIDIDNNDYAGIFGYLESGASISNVSLVNAFIRGNEFIGGIVGDNEGGSISNCLVAKSTINGTSYTGAIVGYNSTSGTLDHNYYGNINNVSSGIGCGTANGSKDVTDNDGAVSATFLTDSEPVPSTLSGKVFFYREFTGGKASTICLPFAYTPKNSDGAFYTFDGIKKNGTTYEATMTVETSTSLNPNMPYLFVPAGNNTIKPVLFHGTAAYDATKLTDTKTPWTFIGTYSRLTYVTSGTGLFSDPVYGFAAKAMGDVIAGEFVRADEGAYIPPMRCFLKYGLQSETRGETDELPERITVKLVNDPTSIRTITTQTGKVTFDGWYSLDGQRFNSKPTRKGLYINKGIKVMIK